MSGINRLAAFKILKYLALKGPSYQTEIAKTLKDVSDRTVLRDIKLLEAEMFIELNCQKSVGRGPPRKYWNVTFIGLLFLFSMEKSLREELIGKYKDEWIIFSEWNYFRKTIDTVNIEIHIAYKIKKELERLGYNERIFNNRKFSLKYPLRSSRNEIKGLNEFYKEHFAKVCFDLEEVFDMSSTLLGEELIMVLIDYYSQNPVLRRFLEKQLETSIYYLDRIDRLDKILKANKID